VPTSTNPPAAPRPEAPTTFTDELKRAIRRSGVKPSVLAVRANISPALLSRFISGVRPSLTTATVDRLVDILDLHLVGGGQPEATAKGSRKPKAFKAGE